MSEKQRYPLTWPEGWKRTLPGHRVRAQFGKLREAARSSVEETTRRVDKVKLSIDDAFDRIEYELERFGVDLSTVIVSTNLRVNMRGVPAGNQGEPSDPGAAVYWIRKSSAQCMAIDSYTRVADNLAAVAATLEAMRAIERHGGAQILDRAFIGFAQLAESRSVDWRKVFGVGPNDHLNADAVNTRFRALAHRVHSDKEGGSHDAMVELNAARDAALREVSE
jgi:hypothetical protein